MIPPAQPFFPTDERDRLHAHLDDILDGWLSKGPRIEEFERSFAESVGVRHAVAVSSGTAALYVALRAYELNGAEVIVPTMTCFACASAILLAGGRPQIVNVDSSTLCIDYEEAAAKVSGKTRGIMLVHLAGRIVPDIDRFRRLCSEKGLFLLEDAAQATGARRGGKVAGSFGDVACFSFSTTKIITTGEGGMIVTDDSEVADFCRRFREMGESADGMGYELAGLNLRMPEFSAALGIEQLRHLEDFVEERNRIVDRYESMLASVPGAELLRGGGDARSSHWKVYASIRRPVDRDLLARRMEEEFRVRVWPAYRPLLHGHPALRPYVQPDDLRPSQELMDQLICLPIYVSITASEQERVVAGLSRCLREGGSGPPSIGNRDADHPSSDGGS